MKAGRQSRTPRYVYCNALCVSNRSCLHFIQCDTAQLMTTVLLILQILGKMSRVLGVTLKKHPAKK